MPIFRKFMLLIKLIGLDPLGGIGTAINNIYQALAMLPPIFAQYASVANYLHLSINCERFYSLLDELQEIAIERAKKVENEVIYMRAKRRISLVSKIFICGLLLAPIFTLSPFVLTAYDWLSGKYTVESWVFFFSTWTPFELNTASRCALMVLLQTTLTTIYTTTMFIVPWMMIVFLICLEAFFSDIKQLLLQVDRLSRCKIPELPKPKNRTDHERKNAERALATQRYKLELKMLEHFKEAVDLHKKVIRLMDNLAKAMNFIIFMTVTPYASCTCLSLLMVEKYSGTNLLYDMQLPILGSVIPLSLLAVFFYMGQWFHSNMMAMNDAVYQTEWYRYPQRIRRFVLLMMMRSQQPFYLGAYGLMYLNLETFVGLVNWMYSALMLMRSLDQE